MPLTDLTIRKEKPSDKIVKLSDGGGLQLWITPDGAKRWRLAYRFSGKQRVAALGVYPSVSLADASKARDAARAILKDGRDPVEAKRVAKAADLASRTMTFAAMVERLLDKKRAEAKSESTVGKVDWLLSLATPALGQRPISDITAPEILAVLRGLEARGRLETANRLRATIGQVFRFAIAQGSAQTDPTYGLRGAIATPVVSHRPAITEGKPFGGLLRAVAAYEGMPETKAALELLALTFVRPGELRAAAWSEFDLDAGLWLIPAGRMKMRRPHRVPLAPQAIAILRGLREVAASSALVFPSVRSLTRPMSENTLNAALRRMGFRKSEMTAHGFRSAASSLLNESGQWNADAVEAQLAHVDSDSVRRAYQRAEFWDERVRMMAWWADRCDEMRRGGEVVRFQKSGGGAA